MRQKFYVFGRYNQTLHVVTPDKKVPPDGQPVEEENGRITPIRYQPLCGRAPYSSHFGRNPKYMHPEDFQNYTDYNYKKTCSRCAKRLMRGEGIIRGCLRNKSL